MMILFAPFVFCIIVLLLLVRLWTAVGYTRITIVQSDGKVLEFIHVRGTLFEQRARRMNEVRRRHGYTLDAEGVSIHDTRLGVMRYPSSPSEGSG